MTKHDKELTKQCHLKTQRNKWFQSTYDKMTDIMGNGMSWIKVSIYD